MLTDKNGRLLPETEEEKKESKPGVNPPHWIRRVSSKTRDSIVRKKANSGQRIINPPHWR